MKRAFGGGLLLAAVMSGLLATNAGAFGVGGKYVGEVKGDPRPGSGISFDIERTESGRRVVDVLASGLDYTCEDDSTGETSGVLLTRGFRIRRDRTFGGRADAVILGIDPPARFTGKLRRHGRATGTIRVHGELDPDGHPGLDCDTGRLEWRARRQPPVVKPRLHGAGGAFEISFTLLVHDGTAKALKRFRFSHLEASCDGGATVEVEGKIRRIRINARRRFHKTVRRNGKKVRVRGRVSADLGTVRGRIRAWGDFDGAQDCDSGRVRWRAS